jgi:phytol kinase
MTNKKITPKSPVAKKYASKNQESIQIPKPRLPLSELKRKIIHILFGMVFIGLIYFTGTSTSMQILSICLSLGVIFSLMIKKGMYIPFLKNVVESVERDNERIFPGKAAVYFFISAIIVLFIFKDNPQIALAALSVEIFADAAAALVGMSFGRTRIYHRKTLEGTLTCFIVATVTAWYFFPMQLPIAIVAGIVATVVEVLPLDDNLWVPLITATAIKAALMF